MNSRENLGRTGEFTAWIPPVIKKCMEKDSYSGTMREVWWAEYSFLIPAPLKHQYPNQVYKAFKVKLRINRVKTESYNQWLLDEITGWLKAGNNPFEEDLKLYYKQQTEVVKELADKTKWDFIQASNYFFTKWDKREVSKGREQDLRTAAGYLIDWLKLGNLHLMPASQITFLHIEATLEHFSQLNKWGGRNYNNNKSCLNTVFKMLLKYSVITLNPVSDVDSRKTTTQIHQYYNEAEFKIVRLLLERDDQLVLFASQIVYHLCIRSDQELAGLQVKHIDRGRMVVIVPKEIAKTDTDRVIPMNPKILQIFEDRRIFDFPPNHYVFSPPAEGKYATGGRFISDGMPGKIPVKTGFFSHRFRYIRDKAKLTSRHTLYGFKHTRAIHFIQDGGEVSQLMVLMGHRDMSATMKYLRDLGVSLDQKKINANNRDY